MKLQIKQNQIDKSMCIQLGYCGLDSLLSFFAPYWYTCGVYGWNSDIYFHDGYFISTGYRPIGQICPPYELVEKYNKQAYKIATSSNPNRQKEIEQLFSKFIKEVTK